jgi:hypothetical protein
MGESAVPWGKCHKEKCQAKGKSVVPCGKCHRGNAVPLGKEP